MADRVVVREAQPTPQEGQQYARYSNEASHGVVRILFGAHFEQILGRAYLSPGHDMSYEHVVFAETDAGIVGMASGFSFDDHRTSTVRPVLQAARLRGIRLVPFGILGLRFFSFVNTVPEGDYYVAALAVDDTSRGQGVASMLLDDTEKRAAAAGCTRLVLDVETANHHAQRVYQRRGMTIEGESPAIAFMPDKRVYRMVKTL